MALVDTGSSQEKVKIESKEQLVRLLQMDIADEQSASSTYDRQLEGIADTHVRAVLEEIRNDEYDHIKKLTELIDSLNPAYTQAGDALICSEFLMRK